MNVNFRSKHVVWFFLSVICVAAFFSLARLICYKKFSAHVWLCAHFPQLAKYSELIPVNDESIDLVLHKDDYAFRKFTESFSQPTQVTIVDTKGFKYLKRIWNTDGGYLVLVTGRDPRDYEIFISYSKGDSIDGLPYEQETEMKTVTKKFLDDYKVVLTTISPGKDLEIEYETSIKTGIEKK